MFEIFSKLVENKQIKSKTAKKHSEFLYKSNFKAFSEHLSYIIFHVSSFINNLTISTIHAFTQIQNPVDFQLCQTMIHNFAFFDRFLF